MKEHRIMMNNFLTAAAAILLFAGCIFRMDNAPAGPEGKNTAELLGYPASARLLVVNIDDTGIHPAFSEGAFEVMKAGLVKSTSIMVTDRNDDELRRIARIAREHPDWGFGIHLWITSSFQEAHPWKTVLPRKLVPTLYNKKGFPRSRDVDVDRNVDPREAALEFEAQIKKALSYGIPLTHIDSHMGTYYRDSLYPGAEKKALRMAAISIAEKYKLPITMHTFSKKAEPEIRYLDSIGLIRPDTFFGIYDLEAINRSLGYKGGAVKKFIVRQVVKLLFGFQLPYKNETVLEKDIKTRTEIYKQAIRGITRPGLNHFLIHATVERSSNGSTIPGGVLRTAEEIKIIRMGDKAVWSGEEMRKFLKDEGIILVNYQKLQRILAERRRNKK